MFVMKQLIKLYLKKKKEEVLSMYCFISERFILGSKICQPSIDQEIKDDAEICDFLEILKL